MLSAGRSALVTRAIVGIALLLLTYGAYSAGTWLASPAKGEIPGGVTQVAETEGFDTCAESEEAKEAFEVWKESSPFSYISAYLGGRNAACEVSRAWVENRYASKGKAPGYNFLPLWVGRQSECTPDGAYDTFTNDPEKARGQAAEEADLAAARAEKYGFNPGAIIYYDIEPWNVESSVCSKAFESFMNVWSKRLREQNHFKAGVYGGDCAGGINKLWGVTNKPNDVWLAHYWPLGTAKRKSVYKVECVPQAHWEEARFHQYDGEFGYEEYREYGGVALLVNSDCANGLDDGKWADGQLKVCIEK